MEMGWETALYLVGFGIAMFLIFSGPQEIIKIVMNGKVKVAEANARAEEAKLERARLEQDRQQYKPYQ